MNVEIVYYKSPIGALEIRSAGSAISDVVRVADNARTSSLGVDGRFIAASVIYNKDLGARKS